MGISAALGSSALLPAGLGFRNKIINGAMIVAQRGTAAITGSGSIQYPVDRWIAVNSVGTVTFQQSTTAPAGFTNSIVATVTATGSYGTTGYTAIAQRIEGYNVADCAFGTASAKQITLSFWVRSSVVGDYSVVFVNNADNRFLWRKYTINTENIWEYKTVQFVGDTSGTWVTGNTIGLAVSFQLGRGSAFDGPENAWSSSAYLGASGNVDFAANAGATFYITGVQLEQNYQPTPFEQRPFGVELSLCQRYYYRYSNPTGNGGGVGYLAGFSSTRAFGTINIPVEMRGAITITPTSCTVDSLGLSTVGNVTAIAAYATTGNAPYTTTLFIDCTTTGTVAGTLYLLRVASGGQLQFSAEI
jgi:hypothetical protein